VKNKKPEGCDDDEADFDILEKVFSDFQCRFFYLYSVMLTDEFSLCFGMSLSKLWTSSGVVFRLS
ncbi:hypothetical protein RYX45_22025, partial [Alkalihalophilus pseudofirmus]